jgi:hypothetical protein
MAVNLLKAKLQLRLDINVFCAEFTNVLNIDSLGKKLVNAKKKKERKNIYWKKYADFSLLHNFLRLFKSF